MDNRPHNVYALGARQGLWAGLYFSAIFLLQTLGGGSIVAMLLGNFMIVAVPFLLYHLLRHHYIDTECRATLSEVWMHGIMIFICGSVILAMVSFIFLKYIDTGFIYRETAKLISVYNSLGSGAAAGMADQLSNALDARMLPSAIQCAFSFLWLGGFSGSMLSLIEAGLIKLFVKS